MTTSKAERDVKKEKIIVKVGDLFTAIGYIVAVVIIGKKYGLLVVSDQATETNIMWSMTGVSNYYDSLEKLADHIMEAGYEPFYGTVTLKSFPSNSKQ